MKSPILTTIVAAAGLLALTGCGGDYKLTLEVANVINAPEGKDNARDRLDVDVVIITKEAGKRYPNLLEGGVNSEQWFKAKDGQTGEFTAVTPDNILSFRSGSPNSQKDNQKGPALSSGIDLTDGKRTTEVSFKHPNPGNDNAAILVFGRFYSPTRPVVIKPPPKEANLRVNVGRTGLSYTPAK